MPYYSEFEKKPVSQLPDGLGIFVTNLYGRDQQSLVQFLPTLRSDSLHHNIVRFKETKIDVKIPKLKKKVSLRIPASRWKKLVKDKTLSKQQTQKLKRLYKEYRNVGAAKRQCWSAPVESKKVSSFASPRTLPNGHSYFHTGVDLRARTGRPIYSPSDGEVIFAEELVVPGKTVVINHGSGILSRYLHLSEFRVAVGDKIQKSEIIGLAGATGRVEAAHLHWEVIWKSTKTNPFLFLKKWNAHCNQNLAYGL